METFKDLGFVRKTEYAEWNKVKLIFYLANLNRLCSALP
jgi:hypothetical protein